MKPEVAATLVLALASVGSLVVAFYRHRNENKDSIVGRQSTFMRDMQVMIDESEEALARCRAQRAKLETEREIERKKLDVVETEHATCSATIMDLEGDIALLHRAIAEADDGQP